MLYLVPIAMYLGAMVTAAGFIIMHYAVRRSSALLRIASFILIIGGILGLFCMASYSYVYWQEGYFTTLMPFL